MKVLVGCEESGTVRDAFLALGHDAWSNDLIPARNGGPHLQMDVMAAIDEQEWDIIILHPDCTSVCVAGNWVYADSPARAEQTEWIKNLWIKARSKARVGCALENPLSVIWPVLRPLSDGVQFIQPYMFGHPEKKKTGLALHGLPRLEGTRDVYQEMMELPRQKRERVLLMSPSLTRKRDRSITYSGIASAMAQQWTII